MQKVIFGIMNQYGYIGIFLLIAIENIFPPIPSEVILAFGGFMTTNTSLNIWGVIVFSTMGSIVGAFFLYEIGRVLNKERLKKIISGRVGRWLCLKKEDVEKADQWFDSKGSKAVFIGRFIPIVRSLISIPAGMSDMPRLSFLLYTFLGTLIWNSVLTYLGAVMGENWKVIVDYVGRYATVVSVMGIILVFIVFYYFHKRK